RVGPRNGDLRAVALPNGRGRIDFARIAVELRAVHQLPHPHLRVVQRIAIEVDLALLDILLHLLVGVTHAFVAADHLPGFLDFPADVIAFAAAPPDGEEVGVRELRPVFADEIAEDVPPSGRVTAAAVVAADGAGAGLRRGSTLPRCGWPAETRQERPGPERV